jgi:phosphatidate cytidylyltransferase
MSIRARLQSALWMIPLAVLAILFLPTPYMAGLMALILLGGLYEWAGLAGIKDETEKLLYVFANACAIAWLAWFDSPDNTGLKTAVLIGAVFCLLSLAWLRHFNFAREHTIRNKAIKLIAGSLSCIPAWAALVLIHESSQGQYWTLFAIGMIAASDSGAYLFGVNFGKHKLAPNISPGKSWEGFWGGLVTTVVFALICMPLFDGSWPDAWRFALLAMATALFSVSGDLFESLLKRHAMLKDSSNLIPGHGGMLDRLDSIVSGLVVFAFLKFWLGL